MKKGNWKRFTCMVFLTIAILSACSKLDIQKGTPKCITKEIKDFDKAQACDNANVASYKFQGETVYTFSPGNCGADMTTEVLDSDCNSLGLLGGFIGNNLINGESFSNAVFIQMIWTK